MQLHSVIPHLLYEFKDERALIKAIEELSVKFTQKRQHINDYLKDERLAAAYTAFYLTTNMPKLEAVFKWMPPSWPEILKTSTFIDLGAGPGTFSLALREWLGVPAQKMIQIETSEVMRKQGKKLWDGLYPGEELIQLSHWKPMEEGSKVLFFGHAANEMGVETSLRYIKDISPDHILFVEPGTKDFFPQMLAIREALVAQNFNIVFPCPSAASCPLAGSTEDWCHQFIQVKQEAEIERISQMAKKDRRLLPLIFHAFSKTMTRETFDARIIRTFPETKFSYEWEVCEDNQVELYQVMKRGLTKNSQELFKEALAGAALAVELEKKTEQSKRVKINRMNKDHL